MSTIKNLLVTGTASGSNAAAGPTQFIRKQEFDAALGSLNDLAHPPITVSATNSVDLVLPSGTQQLSAAVRRKTTGFADFEGAILETAAGLVVSLGNGPNQAARGSDLANALTLIDGKAPTSHSHSISDITGLQTALDGKSDTSHTHSNASSSVAGFMSAADKAKLDALGAGGTTKYSQSFSDGVLTAFNINHNLGSEDVIVQVRRTVDPKDVVECDVRVVDANNVLLSFAAAPTSGSLRVTVI
jgi:hypothetical protein